MQVSSQSAKCYLAFVDATIEKTSEVGERATSFRVLFAVEGRAPDAATPRLPLLKKSRAAGELEASAEQSPMGRG